jgi:hypothetical protein
MLILKTRTTPALGCTGALLRLNCMLAAIENDKGQEELRLNSNSNSKHTTNKQGC